MVNSDPLIPFFDSKYFETDSNRVKIDDDNGLVSISLEADRNMEPLSGPQDLIGRENLFVSFLVNCYRSK